ncbi:MAG: hypothetical protein ACLVG1_10120 [Monoglobus pectinilyticus]|uniref:hypothetical protein n=1 Tax=Monoglobus pectinilyticus TaxID=1981510 RepID=UPI00399BEA0C
MLTEFGKAIRKIRLDKGEILRYGEAAVFPQRFVSCGKRKKNVPENGLIIEFYQLDEEGQKKLKQAYFETKDSAAIFGLENMAKSSDTKRKAALVFTRTFENMSDETAEQILKVLQNNAAREEKKGE